MVQSAIDPPAVTLAILSKRRKSEKTSSECPAKFTDFAYRGKSNLRTISLFEPKVSRKFGIQNSTQAGFPGCFQAKKSAFFAA